MSLDADARLDADLVARVLAVVRGVLHVPGLGPDDDLLDAGATSLALVRIVTLLALEHGVEVDPRALDARWSVARIAQVAQRVAGPDTAR